MRNFNLGADNSDTTAQQGYTLNFYHLPSGKEVSFKAFVTNFSDQYQSNWDKEEVYGRMDPIQTFRSTQRVINVSFDVVAGNLPEAMSNMKEMSDLFSMLYPSYTQKQSGTAGMNGAPLLRVKYLNFITRAGANAQATAKEGGLLGSCSGFNFEPEMGDAMFGDSQGNLYPKIVRLSFTFSVIHEHPLGWSGSKLRESNFPYGNVVNAAKKENAKQEQGLGPEMAFTSEEVAQGEEMTFSVQESETGILDVPPENTSQEDKLSRAEKEFLEGEQAGRDLATTLWGDKP